uniref:Syntaxin binding protein 3 n=1 Tax=Astatotilapia calliptera TaxID=8154 RepID=A0AAX7VQJ8_ASTCA
IMNDNLFSDYCCILILDPFTTKLLSSCCKMSDLMSEKITIVEDLFKSREPVLEMKSIYFMTPTAKCVDAFIKDFKPKPKYKAAYVYFTDYCPDDLFNKMRQACGKHIRVCKEINISFMPQEAQVFTCDNPGAFRSIYSPKSQDKTKTLETLAGQLVTLCATLDEYPGIRYKKGFDPVTPILHELTYQAMAYDLIDIENDTYKYKARDGLEKQALLNEDDMLWVKLRHQHIAEVSKTIHLQLAEDCMKHFANNVEKLCKAEQDLAVGADVDGLKVKDPMRTLLPVLLNPYSKHDKIRAVLLYIFSLNGTTEENLNKLIEHVKIEGEPEYIQNWKELGVPIIITPSFFSRKPNRRERSQEERYSLSRWIPTIKDVMEDVVENKLDTKEWPHQSECPAAWNGSGAVSARQKHRASTQDDRRTGSRLIIFVIGGISFSEMRCAYEVTRAMKTCEVIIGSSHILTPTVLLDDIKALSKGPMESFTLEVETKA